MKLIKNNDIIFNKKQLKDIITIKSGKRLPKGHEYIVEKTGYYYLKVGDLNNNNLDFNQISSIDFKTFKILERYKLNYNDLILSIIGTVGKTLIYNEKEKEVILTENCIKLIPNEKEVTKDYLELYLCTKEGQLEIDKNTIKTAMPKLSIERCKEIFIYLPSLEIQNKISLLMNSQKKYIKKIKSLLEKIEIRNNYYADKLLSGELSIGEDGRILNVQNNHYELKKIKEIVDISIGSTPSIEEYNGHIPWITIADLSKNIEETNKKLKKTIKSVEAGSLIISFKLTVGSAKILNQESCTNEAILRIEPSKIKEDVSIDYLYYILPNLLKQHSVKNAYGASILNTKEIKEIPVKIFKDHKNISVFLKSLEDEKDNIERLLELEEKRFEWLSDKLLSGEYIIED